MPHLRKRLFPVVAILGLFIFLAAGACAIQKVSPGSTPGPTSETSSAVQQVPAAVPEEFSKVWESWALLKQRHLLQDSLDAEELSRAAVKGMLQALDDTHAAYLPPGVYARHIEDLRGSYEGIGAQVTLRNNQITIVLPFAGSPAERAGLKSGDIILAVNGEPTIGLSLHEAVSMVRGAKGSTVELTVRHADPSLTEKITIVRDVIETSSVDLEIKEDGTAHLVIQTFAENTDEELRDVLREMNRKRVTGVVLDLRNNLGGSVSTVVNVASQFLNGGLIFYHVDGQGQRTDLSARRGGLLTDTPMVVLVNEFSASGSEVLAGALQFHDRAKVIGTTTFGKGIVNVFLPLSDGSGITFTIASYFTPDGKVIEGVGLTPDVVVTEEEGAGGDSQLDRALEILRDSVAALP